MDWSATSGLTTNITNRLETPLEEDKIGILKGSRTLTQVNDLAILDEAKEILSRSIFPNGIKDMVEYKLAALGQV